MTRMADSMSLRARDTRKKLNMFCSLRLYATARQTSTLPPMATMTMMNSRNTGQLGGDLVSSSSSCQQLQLESPASQWSEFGPTLPVRLAPSQRGVTTVVSRSTSVRSRYDGSVTPPSQTPANSTAAILQSRGSGSQFTSIHPQCVPKSQFFDGSFANQLRF